MKRRLGYLLITLIAVSCSAPDGTFSLKGKFKNFNQGELYIYTMDGRGKIDTVRLANSKFEYVRNIEDTVLLSVIFPNYSEIPIVAMPGTECRMDGDASHLRDVAVNGNEENELLTQFRLDVNEKTPPEALKAAETFITEHPESPACVYVLNRFFLLKANADVKKAQQLLALMVKAAPTSQRLQQLQQQLKALRPLTVGSKLASFSVVALDGRRVTNADLTGDVNVISVWADKNYESLNMQRQLRSLKKDFGHRLQVVGICLDGNPNECRKTVERDSLVWPNVCDGLMWQTPAVAQLGIQAIPENIIVGRDGKIIATRLSAIDLKTKIESLLK